MTDKLTPGQLRDLADLCNVGNRVVTLHANGETTRFYPNKDLAHVLREEAARREAEARPTRQDDFQWCENCPTAEVCRIGGCNGGERIGPLTGIEAGPDAVHPKPPCDKPAPAADDPGERLFTYDTGGGYMRSMTAPHVEAEFALLHGRATKAEAEAARLREALEMIAWSTDSKWQQDAARAALARGGDHG